MSARNLARRTTIHHSFVCRIIAGECATISAARAARMAEVLGVRPAVLFRPAPANTKRTHIKREVNR